MTKRYTTVAVICCSALLLSSCSYKKKRTISQPPAAVPVQTWDSQASQPVDERREGGFEDRSQFERVQDPLLPDMQYVEDRILEYNRKLARWKELDRQALALELDEANSDKMVTCLRELQRVTNGYNRLQSALRRQDQIGSAPLISGSEVMRLEQQDIAFLESGCGRLLADGDDGTPDDRQQDSGQTGLSQLESLIKGHGANGEFEEVLQAWEMIPAGQRQEVGLDTKIVYANALMVLRRQGEAARVYEEVANLMSMPGNHYPDGLTLRKTLADLYMASARYELAKVEYRKISEEYKELGQVERLAAVQLSMLESSGNGSLELQKYSSLLGSYQGFNPQRDGYKVAWQAESFLNDYPSSSVSENVEMIRASAKGDADQWVEAFIAEVDEMAEGERFEEALAKLEALPEGIVSGEKAMALKAKRDDLTLAAAMGREARKQQNQMALEQQWTEAMRFFDMKSYDEAIEILSTMQDSEYGIRAESKVTEASLLAARADRRKAADLFIQSTQAQDIESKKKLLLESRRHLLDILIKYPDVEITDKVRGNIERVEKEMNKIDPNLISQSEQVGDEVGENMAGERNSSGTVQQLQLSQ